MRMARESEVGTDIVRPRPFLATQSPNLPPISPKEKVPLKFRQKRENINPTKFRKRQHFK